MKFEIIDRSERGYFIVKTYEDFSVYDNSLMLNHVILQPNWHKCFGLLVDYSRVSFENFNLDNLNQVVDIVAAIEKTLGIGRCAIVAPQEGIIFTSFYKYEIDSKVQMDTQVFPSDEYGNALNWVGQK